MAIKKAESIIKIGNETGDMVSINCINGEPIQFHSDDIERDINILNTNRVVLVHDIIRRELVYVFTNNIVRCVMNRYV